MIRLIHVDELIYAAAKERLAAAGWNNIDYAVEYFLAECVVRKQLKKDRFFHVYIKLKKWFLLSLYKHEKTIVMEKPIVVNGK